MVHEATAAKSEWESGTAHMALELQEVDFLDMRSLITWKYEFLVIRAHCLSLNFKFIFALEDLNIFCFNRLSGDYLQADSPGPGCTC